MIAGLSTFARAFAGFEQEYVLIGGAACSVVFGQFGLPFRLTHDLDIVLLAEGRDGRFASALWAFLRAGGYAGASRADGSCTYYRFQQLQPSADYPTQLELFARHPDFPLAREDTDIAPLPFDGYVSSLSAIILDDAYYKLIKDNVLIIDGVSVLKPQALIVLKMRAHVDLNRRHAQGLHVNQRDLRKHRRDVAELAGILDPSERFELTDAMRHDAELFLEDFRQYSGRETSMKKKKMLADRLELLQNVYL